MAWLHPLGMGLPLGVLLQGLCPITGILYARDQA